MDSAADISTYSTGFANQVADDWASTWLTDLYVTSQTYCPDDFPEETFGRRFHGTTIGCDCLGIYS